MINNKRGLSGVIVTLITVLLAIVAIGIIWAVVSGLLDRNIESIDTASMCQGALIKINSVTTTSDTECSVNIERIPGLAQETISGVDVSVDDNTVLDSIGDLILSKTIVDVECDGTPTKAVARVYFDLDGSKNYCTPIEWTA